MPILSVQNTWFTQTTCIPSRSPEFWYLPGRGYLLDLSPIKIISVLSFPGWQHFRCVVTTRCWGEWSIFCETPMGGDLANWCMASVRLCAMQPFPLNFLYPFAVVNLSCELSPVSPASNHQGVIQSYCFIPFNDI